MHGEIRIVKKEMGERGGCFRFNVLLSICPQPADHIQIISKSPVPVDCDDDDEHEIPVMTGQRLSEKKHFGHRKNGVTGLRIRHIMLSVGATIEFCTHKWQAIDPVQEKLRQSNTTY